jgi:hypothetical protein
VLWREDRRARRDATPHNHQRLERGAAVLDDL